MRFFQLSLLDLIRGRRKPEAKPPPLPGADEHHLNDIWRRLCAAYFPGRADLLEYRVFWSRRRQRRVLASVNLRRRMVSVARELDHPNHAEWLDPLLYHELCHAALGLDLSKRNGKRPWHGQEFRQLESRHPRTRALDAWIKGGGWRSAVRSERARRQHERRRSAPLPAPIFESRR